MDLARRLLALLAPLRPGDEVAPGARLLGASTERGPRFRFSVGEREIEVELAPSDPLRPHAARTRHFLVSYVGTIPAADGLSLCRAVAALVAPREAELLAELAREAGEPAPRIREVSVEHLLEPAGTDGERYLTLSPYVGCLIGCRFCYAQSHVAATRSLLALPVVPWGSFVDARVNAAEVLARELPGAPKLPVKFCPIVSDPYQAVEERYRLTRACLEVLRGARPTLLLTRSKLIVRDLDLLRGFPSLWAGASIPTIDEEARRHFEPRAATIAERLAAMTTLRDAGVATFAVVQPLLPGPIDLLADALAGAVSSVSLGVLRGVEGAGSDFADPKYSASAADEWQADRVRLLATALEERGVAIWPGELPPGI
jgi:hypothetical protein